jgi:hypothetical protein
MTRGQDSLAIGLEAADGGVAMKVRASRPARLKVIKASPGELQLHAQQSENIDKASDGKCAWKQLELTAAGQA